MKTSLNLLPYALRRRELVRLRLSQWCCIWAVAAVLAGSFFYWGEYVPLQACKERLQARQREYAPVKKLQTELETMHVQLQDLQKREALALSLAEDVPVIALLGVTSRAARQSDASVYVSQMSLDRKAMPVSTDSDRASPGHEPRGVLTLQGAGVDNLSVARFVAALRDSGTFDTVELKSTGVEVMGGTEARSYTVECVY
jgi:hypothetical protein